MNFHLIELSFILCFLVTVILGQRNQNKNEQAICNRYNIPQITWTCKRVNECQWAQNIINTAQEHRCGVDQYVAKICCPERTNVKPTPQQKPKPTPKPTTAPPPPSRNNYIQIIRKKCADYSQARYYNKCIGGQVFGQQEVCKREMDCTQTVDPLIVGGKDAEPKEFPHMAMVGFGNDVNNIDWACGGTLISERFVLSAAHCTEPGAKLGVVKWVALGLLNRNELTPDKLNKNIFRIVKAINHPDYRGPQANYDIAVYQLQYPVKFSPHIRPICLHTEYKIPPETVENVTILGWGRIEAGADVSEKLQKTSVRILSDDLCESTYGGESKLKNGYEKKVMVCAGDEYSNHDTCTGDSGGPIQMNSKEKCMYTQIGITSLGSSFCGDNTPAIYTRVSAYLEWIQKTVWPNGV